MDFFDDDSTSKAAPADTTSPPPPRRSSRRRTRVQRIAILAVVLFLVVFALAWWARSCQENRKIESYRTYFEGVAQAIDDSATLGKQFNQVVKDPTKFSRQQLTERLDELDAKQAEIAVRARRLEHPGKLDAQHAVFAEGMDVRSAGFTQLRALMLRALDGKQVKPVRIAALDAYFTGPEAYYMERFYLPAREVMAEDGVSDVAVPTVGYFLGWTALDIGRVETMLERMGGSSKLAGIRGVELAEVIATTESERVPLTAGDTVDVPASAQLAFEVKVENQGDVTEEDVPVTVTLVLPSGDPLEQAGTIASIASGKTQSVTVQGFNIPEEALSKVITVRVKAGPVPQEQVLDNNSRNYKILLQLQ